MKRNSKGQFIGKKEEAGRWKGGKVNYKGYIRVYMSEHPYANNNYILEHRLIMEQYLGRYLFPEEIVHHINGIKDDNQIENLEIYTRKDHQNIHRKGKSLDIETKNKISQSLMGQKYYGH